MFAYALKPTCRFILSALITFFVLISPRLIAQEAQTVGKLDVDRLGAAVYSLPISAINGVGGVKPNIAAVYNSQAPNGILGKGTSLSGLSVIKRCQQTLVRDGQNKAMSWTAEDRFCLDAQRLMLVGGTQGSPESQYRTEIDNGVLYTAKGGTLGNPDYFEAKAEDGATLIFGGSSTAKELGGATMTWALSQYQDSAQNTIQYVYEGTAADGLRIKRINYAFTLPNTTLNPGAYIEFIYKDRDDPISKYVAGYEFRTNKLLTQINTYGMAGLLYRSYQFDTATSTGLAGYVSRLQSAKECTTFTNCFDATQFEWGRTQKNITTNNIETKNITVDFLGKIRRDGIPKGAQLNSAISNCCTVQAADINGNGTAEFFWIELFESGSYGYIGSFDGASLASDSPKYTSALPYSSFSFDPDMPPLEFVDINADGFQDVIQPLRDTDYAGRRLWGIEKALRTSNTWMIDYYWHKQVSNTVHNFVKPIDSDGDGFQEVLGIDKRSVDFSLYKTDIVNPNAVAAPDYRGISGLPQSLHLSDIPTANSIYVEYRGDMIASGDFNNDGKKDLLLLVKLGYPATNNQIYKINWYEVQGTQLVFKETLYQESKTPLETYADAKGEYRLREFVEFKKLKVIDINGDGLDDVVFQKNGVTMYAINKGNGFLPFVTIPKSVVSYPEISATFIDVNNDGQADYIYAESTYQAGANPSWDYTNPKIYVRYWNSKIAAFDAPVLLRTTPDYPILFADMNGDGFVDIVENHRVERDRTQDTINVYGFTNNVGNATVGFQGVLDQDTIVSVKTGVTVNASIDYQTLIKPKNINILSCSSGISGTTPCYDFLSDSQYKPLSISVVRKPNSLDGLVNEPVVNGSPYYYTKTNDPFLGLNNPYAGDARVSQYVAPLPIVIRAKTTQNNTTSDKKYFYNIMRTQAGGRGLLGFEKTSVQDVTTGARTDTLWRLDWPYTGNPSTTYSFNGSSELLKEKAYIYNVSTTADKQFKLTNNAYENFYTAGEITSTNVYVNGVLSTPQNTSSVSSASSSSSSVSSAASYPMLLLTSPMALETHALEDGNEYVIIAKTFSANSVLYKNSYGLNPKIFYYINGVLQTGLRTDLVEPIKYWKPTMAGDYVVETRTTLEDGTQLISNKGTFRITQAGAPSITLTKPIADSTVKTGDPIFISATASDADGTVKYISYYANGVLIGTTDENNPAHLTWVPNVAGEVSISAVATDSSGKKTTSVGRRVFVTSTSSSASSQASSIASDPYVELSAPLPYIKEVIGLGAETPLFAYVRNSDGSVWLDNDYHEAKIDFYANGNLITNARKDPSGPMLWWKPTEAGSYGIKAVANLGGGKKVESKMGAITVMVTGMPVVNLTAPQQNKFIKLGDTLTLSASASDPDGNLSWVRFFANNEQVPGNNSDQPPYSVAWKPTALGEYTIRAVAMDATYIKSTSGSVTISVVEPGAKPSASITSPDDGSSIAFGTAINIAANAVDLDGTVAKVEFYANNQMVGSATTAPYKTSFTPKSTGSYELVAIAYDNLGNSTPSASHTIQYGLAAPKLNVIDNDDDCFVGINFNASKNTPNNLVYELYVRPVGQATWPSTPVLQRSGAQGDVPPFKAYFADHAPGSFEYRSRVCPSGQPQACSLYSDAVPVNVRADCRTIALPQVSLINPPSKVKLGDTVTLTAQASISQTAISSVHFYYGEQDLGAVIRAPYTLNWKPTETGHDVLYAVAEGTNEGTAVSALTITDVLTPVDFVLSGTTGTVQISSSGATSSVSGNTSSAPPGNTPNSSQNISSSPTASIPVPLTNGQVNDPAPTGAPTNQLVGVSSGQFRVDESGAATYSIPLSLPDGVAGVKPQLSLDYSSNAGNGIAGQGWSVSGLSAVSRCRQTLSQDNNPAPITWSESDRFCFNGQRLILVSGTYGASGSTYRTEIDSFAVVTAVGGSLGHPAYFTVEAKDGSTAYYGNSSDSKLAGSIASPGTTTLTWAINRFSDSLGNSIDFFYEGNAAEGQRIKQIYYAFPTTNYLNTAGSQRTDGNAKITFNYTDRLDIASNYVAGYEFGQKKKLANILVENNSDTTGWASFRYYNLKYMDQSAALARYQNKVSRLEAFTECKDSSMSQASCYQPLTFKWGGGSHVSFDQYITSWSLANTGSGKYILNHLFTDINGDGRQDLVFLRLESASNTANDYSGTVSLNVRDSGGADVSSITFSANYYPSVKIAVLDYNADGHQDIALYKDGSWSVYLSTLKVYGGGSKQWVIGDRVIALNSLASDTVFADMNSDGLVDAVSVRGINLLTRDTTQALASDTFYKFDSASINFEWEPDSQFKEIYKPGDTTPSLTNTRNCVYKSLQKEIVPGQIADFNGDGIPDFVAKVSAVYDCETGPVNWVHIDLTIRSEYYAMVTAKGSTANLKKVKLYVPDSVDSVVSGKVYLQDLNGDGLTDLVYTIPDDHNIVPPLASSNNNNLIYRINTGTGFTAPVFWQQLPVDVASGARVEPQFVDYNGDGYTDLSWPDTTTGQFYVRLWGDGSDAKFSIKNIGIDPESSHYLADINGDGILDYIGVSASRIDINPGVMANLVLGRPCATIYERLNPRSSCPPSGVTNSVSEPVSADEQTSAIVAVINGLGNTTNIYYGTLATSGRYIMTDVNPVVSQVYPNVNGPCPFNCPMGYYTKTDLSSFYTAVNGGWPDLPSGSILLRDGSISTQNDTKQNPVIDVNGSTRIVVAVASSAPAAGESPQSVDINAMSKVNYFYAQARIQAAGRGFLGFARLTTVDAQSGVATATLYRQDFPFTGSPLSTTVYKSIDPAAQILSQATNKWNLKFGAATGIYQPYLQESVEKSYSTTGTELQTITTTTEMDTDGNPTSIKTLVAGGGQSLQKTTISDYGSDAWSKRLGRLASTTVTTVFNNLTDPETRTSTFEYYPQGSSKRGLLKSETVEPSSPNTLTTVYTYDDYGNKLTAEATGKNSVGVTETRKTTNVYDANQHRYLKSSTNDLGHSVSNTQRNAFGQPTASTDINGISSEVFYDAMGGEYLSKSDTGAWVRTDTTYCNGNCPAGAKYRSDKQVAGGGKSTEYFDILGRTIRSSKVGFDGRNILVDTEYDSSNRIKRQSTPYFENSVIAGWTTYKYDYLGRPETVTAPDGTQTTYSYSNYESNVSVASGGYTRSRKDTHNGLGQLLRVDDQKGGHIDYTYTGKGDLATATTTSAEGKVAQVLMCYDNLGRKIGMLDPDKGGFKATVSTCSGFNPLAPPVGWWAYQYDAFGELIKQTDAKGQTSSMTYDLIGRMKTRLDKNAAGTVDANTAWFYDKNLNGNASPATQGKLMTVIMSQSPTPIAGVSGDCAGTNHCTLYTYDDKARPYVSLVHYPSGGDYITSTRYDTIGRPYEQHDAMEGILGVSGVQTHYNAYGYAYESVDLRDQSLIARTESTNERGQVLRELRGNGLVTTNTYYDTTGLLHTQTAFNGVGAAVQDNTYVWDGFGNLISRQNKGALLIGGTKNLSETFYYDDLNRLIRTDRPGAVHECAANDVSYDGLGNITCKNGVGGQYGYGVNAGIHAVTSTGTGDTYSYDNNGNQIKSTVAGVDRTMDYTSYDMVKRIAKSGNSIDFSYGPDRARWQRIDTKGTAITTTTYIGNLERIASSTNNLIEWKRYVGGIIYTYQTDANNLLQTTDKRFVYTDHLGSIDAITNSVGILSHTESFDPWGARRDAENWLALTDAQRTAALKVNVNNLLQPITNRGFTGHEMLDDMGIIHMNGRIYDQRLGRFLQADPLIQAATSTQSYNRYSYVLNNPLNATDPSGFFSTWDNIVHAVPVHRFLNNHMPWAIPIIQVLMNFIPHAGPFISAAFGANNAFYLSGGEERAGIKSYAISMAAYYAFSKLGKTFDGQSGGVWQQGGAWHIFAHAMVGGVLSVVQGGKFGNGFVSAGLTKGFMSHSGFDYSDGSSEAIVERVTIAAIVGGTISEITGGKFANGAITEAMAQLFNAEMSEAKKREYLKQVRSQLSVETAKLRSEIESMSDEEFDHKFGSDGNRGITMIIIDKQLRMMEVSLALDGYSAVIDKIVEGIPGQIAGSIATAGASTEVKIFTGLGRYFFNYNSVEFDVSGWGSDCVNLTCGFTTPQNTFVPIGKVASQISRAAF